MQPNPSERVIMWRTSIRVTGKRSFPGCSNISRRIDRCRSSWITIPGGSACSWKRNTVRAAPGRIWRKAPMSGGFACACYPIGVRNLLRSVTSNPDVPVVTRSHREFTRCADDRGLSRAERLEIVSLVAALGVTECSAWLIPMLERNG